MEELYGGSSTGSRRPFRYLPSFTAPPPQSYHYYTCTSSSASSSSPQSHLQAPPPPPPPPHGPSPISHGGTEEIKARIMSHPKYSDLLAAFTDCQKVGAPPEVVARLSAMLHQLALDHPAAGHNRHASPDPELDQFMDLYCHALIQYRQELAKPLQEAKDFLHDIESQFNDLLTNASTRLLSAEKCEGVGSSDEDQDGNSGRETDPQDMDPTEDKELKQRLLKKYGGYLSGLRQELSKNKKKGKLPKDARQKLLNWWELHHKWPYPSETEKIALAESTGLDQKQINNWFINQRKRHWKPSEDMQLFVMDGYHPQTATASGLYSLDGQFMGAEGMYRFGP